MKFTIARTKFLDGLKAVQNIVPTKSTSPIVQNVLLEAKENKLTLRTTDLDISICAVIDCEVKEEGATTLPVRMLFNSISVSIEGQVEITVDAEEKAKIVAGSAKYSMTGLPAKNFPQLPETTEATSFKFPLLTLKEMFRKTAFAAAVDDSRRSIRGVFLKFKDQKLTAVGLDGRRLAMVECEVEFPEECATECTVTNKAVQEIQRLPNVDGDVVIEIKGTQICFSFDNIQLYSKLIDEQYPNFYQVIPKELKERIVIDRQQLIDVIERVSIMCVDSLRTMRFIFESDLLTVTSGVFDFGSARDELPIKYKGEKIEALYNPNYLLDALKVIDDDEVTFELRDGTYPAILKCSIPFLYVILPLRIN